MSAPPAVLIPALNEAKSIGRVLAEVPEPFRGRMVVVDNGSSDGTADAARAGGAMVYLEPHRGYGAVKAQTGKGLMLALHLESAELVQAVAKRAMEKGVILFWLLFTGNALRITPPLTITEEQIKEGCRLIRECLDELS